VSNKAHQESLAPGSSEACLINCCSLDMVCSAGVIRLIQLGHPSSQSTRRLTYTSSPLRRGLIVTGRMSGPGREPHPHATGFYQHVHYANIRQVIVEVMDVSVVDKRLPPLSWDGGLMRGCFRAADIANDVQVCNGIWDLQLMSSLARLATTRLTLRMGVFLDCPSQKLTAVLGVADCLATVHCSVA
jgi:hypothetical protein